MDNYSYVEELKKEFNIDELKSKTLSYRIDGFTLACRLDLSNSICEKLVSPNFLPYINKKMVEDETNYNINFARGYDNNGKYFIMLGKYNELNILFKNYFDEDKNLKKINNLPFEISLGEIYNDFAYQLKIISEDGMRAKFEVTKSKEGESLSQNLYFYGNIMHFSRILRIVRSFRDNPEIVFKTYNDEMKKQKIVFTSNILDKMAEKDETFDEPTGKKGKILKKLLNND